jgi:hypothetical protein
VVSLYGFEATSVKLVAPYDVRMMLHFGSLEGLYWSRCNRALYKASF